jgi:SET domain-containing protein
MNETKNEAKFTWLKFMKRGCALEQNHRTLHRPRVEWPENRA